MKNKDAFFITLAHYLPFKNSNPHPQDATFPWSIAYMASLLEQRRWKITVIDTWIKDCDLTDMAKRIKDTQPSIVVIEVTTTTLQTAKELCKLCEPLDSLFIAFGQHPSALPESVLQERSFDLAIIGEPEYTLLEIAGALEKDLSFQDIKGLAFFDISQKKTITTLNRPIIENLDELPLIKYELFEMGKYHYKSVHAPTFGKIKWGFLLTSRGCPYNCIFCSGTLRNSYGKKYRAHSPGRVIKELETLVEEHKVNFISIEDDVFTLDKKRVEEICERIIKRGLKINWIAQTRPDLISPELARKMKEAGCYGLHLGIESGNNRILKILKKDETKEQMEEAISILKREGIIYTLYFMVGNPTETTQEVRETIKFSKKLSPLMIQVSYFTPYPGSPFYSSAGDSNHDFSDYSHYNRISGNFNAISQRQISGLINRFYKEYYLSFPYILKYLTQRAPYTLWRISELKLIWKSLKYIFSHKKTKER